MLLLQKHVTKWKKRLYFSIIFIYSLLELFSRHGASLIFLHLSRLIKSIIIFHAVDKDKGNLLHNKRDHFRSRDFTHYRSNYSCRYCHYRCPIGQHESFRGENYKLARNHYPNTEKEGGAGPEEKERERGRRDRMGDRGKVMTRLRK